MDTYTEIKSDNQIIRVTYSDWETVSDIMTEWDRHLAEIGIFISPYDRRSSNWGDEYIATGLDNWGEDCNRISVDIDDATTDYQNANAMLENCLSQFGWDYSNGDVLDCLERAANCAEIVASHAEELATHISNRPDVRIIEFCPYVDLIRYFRVYVDVEIYEQDTKQDYSVDNVLEVVKAFNTAYRGGVFHIDIEDENGNDIDSLGGVTFEDECPTDDEILEYVRKYM